MEIHLFIYPILKNRDIIEGSASEKKPLRTLCTGSTVRRLAHLDKRRERVGNPAVQLSNFERIF